MVSSFSKYAVVKARSVVIVGKDLPLDSLSPLGCGIMTGAGGEFIFHGVIARTVCIN
jgi:Zn-dependent alcohol dehydrogenase